MLWLLKLTDTLPGISRNIPPAKVRSIAEKTWLLAPDRLGLRAFTY